MRKTLLLITTLLSITTGNSQSTSDFYDRGISKFGAQDYSGASTSFTRAIEISPKYAQACLGRGISKAMLKDYAGAVADYGNAIKIEPKY